MQVCRLSSSLREGVQRKVLYTEARNQAGGPGPGLALVFAATSRLILLISLLDLDCESRFWLPHQCRLMPG